MISRHTGKERKRKSRTVGFMIKENQARWDASLGLSDIPNFPANRGMRGDLRSQGWNEAASLESSALHYQPVTPLPPKYSFCSFSNLMQRSIKEVSFLCLLNPGKVRLPFLCPKKSLYKPQ